MINSYMYVKSISSRGEKRSQKRGRLPRQHASRHRRPPVAGGLLEESWTVDDSAALWIARAEDDASDARMADRARAHGAGFQRDEQRQAVEAIVADRRRRRPQRQDLGVRGRIMPRNRGIARARHDPSGGRIDHDRAHWGFPA